MSLRHILAVGIALFFVMLVAPSVTGSSEGSSGQAVILVIDNSASMGKSDENCIRNYTIRFFLEKIVNLDCNNDEFALRIKDTFIGNKSHPINPVFSKDCKNIVEVLGGLNRTICSSSEAINHDKILKNAVNDFSKASNNKNYVIYYFSDGIEYSNRSRFLSSTLHLAKEKGVIINTIGFGNDTEGLKLLKYISEFTGGTFYPIESILSIDIEKSTDDDDADFPPGPEIIVGDNVTWTYVVANRGNVNLTSVHVVDDIIGLIAGPITLGAGENQTFNRTGTAVLGQYQNNATVNGTYNGTEVMDTDPSHYFGMILSIDIEKSTNGEDADSAPGPILNLSDNVTWTYVVNNTGNVNLTDVYVVDDIIGLIAGPITLGAGENQTFNITGTAVLGQYQNNVISNGTYNGTEVNDTDLSHYLGIIRTNATVVFALDTSGSMKKYYHLAPNESAEIVSGWSAFENSTVSIVSWDHASELLFGPAPLKGNEDRLAEILDNLSEMCIETDLTYYDQGLNGSLAELRDPASVPPNSSKIIVFLTGYSEFEAGEKLDEYISEANELGCKVFTIGIGINESFEASKNQHLNLTKISEGAGGIFSPVAAFSPGDLNPIMEIISRELEGDLMYAESEPQ